MASEPFNISKIDQSPLDTKEMDSSLSRSSSVTTTQGSSSLPSAGPCIDDNSLPHIPSIRDNDADQEVVAAADTHLPDESQASIDHDNTASNNNDEGQEQLPEEDQPEVLTAAAAAAGEEEEDKPLTAAVTSEPQEPIPLAAAAEEEERPQQEVASFTMHGPVFEGGEAVAAIEEEIFEDGTDDHDLQQQQQLQDEDEDEDRADTNQDQQDLPDQGSSGPSSDNEEHEQTTAPCEMKGPGGTTAGSDEDAAHEDAGVATASSANEDNDPAHEHTNETPVPSSSSSQGHDYSIHDAQVNSNFDGDPANELHGERDNHDPLLPRVYIDEPVPVPAHIQEQHGDGTDYHSQQHLLHEDHIRDDGSEHTVMESRRVWEADRHAAECRRCNRRFNFLVRRHHCRRCGLVVCDRCSGHRIRLPPNEIIQDPAIDSAHYPLIALHPQRVCDVCVRLPIKEVPRSSAVHRRATAPVSMKRSGSSQSLMSECPVCGHDLLGMPKKDQEKHLQLCLNAGSPPARPPRYLVYELSPTSPQINYECPICFEDFKAGEKIARMICLCSYHRRCLSDWLERGKGCPVHYDPTL